MKVILSIFCRNAVCSKWNKKKTLEIMWVNLKVSVKRKEVKTFQTKTTLQPSTLLKLYPGQVRSTIHHQLQ